MGGACPLGRRFALPLWHPAGGMPSLSPAYPAFSLFVCPHPPYPLPGGKGEIFSFFMQGASPPAPRHQTVYGTDRHCHYGTRRGACLFGRRFALPLWHPAEGLPSLSPAYPAFSLFVCPHPPTPLPLRGRGRFLVLLCKGLRPLHPRGGWTGRGTGSVSVGGARRGACPLGRRFARAAAVPGGGLAVFVACRRCL